jgi:hypothetical protein
MEASTITIDEARVLMPVATSEMSDAEVLKLILSLELLASAFIKWIKDDC